MVTKVVRRRGVVKFAFGLVSGMLVVGGATGLAVYAATGAGHASNTASSTGSGAGSGTDARTDAGSGTGTGTGADAGQPVQLAAGTKTPAGSQPGDGTPASPAALAGVPWRQVGPGWELVEYTTRGQTQHGSTTLYLISPSGAHYALYTWRASANLPPNLIDWSGDKARALLTIDPSGQYEQITLATGAVTTHIQLAGGARAIGYTRPSGLGILGSTSSGTTGTIARYSAGGRLVQVLTRGADENNAIYSADGRWLAVSGAKGLELAGNAGGVIRSLPVPGTDPLPGCYPVRWWDATTILAHCTAPGTSIPRLWLVPTGGARPVPLTPQRAISTGDLGDVGAWQLPSGLYLQSLGGCGTLDVYRQAANGSITPVIVPHTTGNDNYVATALGSRLLIEALTGCEGSHSLLWFDPGTHAEQWLLRAPANAFGVTAVVPYYTKENSSPLG